MSNLLLGIDIGTSACKAAVFDERGRVLRDANSPYNVYYPKSGWAEQDADEWWNAVCDAVRRVLSEIAPADIACVGIDGQSWSAIPVDSKGNALARTPIWMDTRARDICDGVKTRLGEDTVFNIAGNDFLPSYTAPKMLWFKKEFPEIFGKTCKFMQSNSYIALKLTGVFSQDVSQLYGIHFYDLHKMKYDDALADTLGLSADLVPDIFPCHGIIGKVTAEAARLTGLCEGTPVVAGGLDAACGTLGAGVYRLGQTQEQGGQAGGMSICADNALAHKKLILSPHVVPGMFLLQGGTVGGGGLLKWFRQELCPDMSFDGITALAENIPAGSEGVVFLPYMAGERSPLWNPDAKGVFYGLGYSKTRGHMVRAVLEGEAFSLEHNLRTAEEVGATVETLNAMGGSANSLLWTQIKSDVTGKPIAVPESDNASTLGAAILAGVGCGVFESFESAVKKCISVKRVHTPDMKKHEIYKKYMELYLRLYKNLEKTFSEFSVLS